MSSLPSWSKTTGTDFARLWDEMYMRSRDQKMRFSTDSKGFWAQKSNVNLFVKRLRADDRGRISTQLNALQFPAGATVLDIGAGPGTLAVPLTLRGCRVTALEPSAPMRSAMAEYQKEMNAADIATIAAGFEDVTAEKLGCYDYVLSSFSLMMGDIRAQLEKMNAAARREVHIFWFLTPPSVSRGNVELWPRLYGEDYCYEPTADILWNVLREMGIFANLAVDTRKKEQIYPDKKTVYEDYYSRMLASSDEQRAVVDAYLKDKIQPAESGFVVPGTSCSAHIWWEPSRRAE